MLEELNGKRVAILGGNKPSREIVAAAKMLGARTVVIDYNPPELSPAKKDADESVSISLADTNTVAKWLVDNSIDGVVTGYTDSILPWYADICAMAGLPCYGTRHQFEMFTNKPKWKELFRKYDIPVAHDYYANDILNAKCNAIYPLFIKPADGSGAKGTSIARNERELASSIEKAKNASRSGEVLVEEYLEGREITVFWGFIDGIYDVFMIGNRHVKHNQSGIIPLPAGYTFPASIIPDYVKQQAPKVRDALASIGIKNGMMFMQCILKEGVPYVYDVGFRLTGSQEQFITKKVADFSFIEMLLHYAVTGRMTDDENISRSFKTCLYAPAFNISLLMKPGTIGSIEGLSVLEIDPHVLAVRQNHFEGETLAPEALGQLRQIAVRILGTVSNPESMMSTILQLQQQVAIQSPNGENLLLSGLSESDFGYCLSPERDFEG